MIEARRCQDEQVKRPIPSSQPRFGERLTNAVHASHALTDDDLDATNRDGLIAAIVAAHAAPIIQLDETTLQVGEERYPSPSVVPGAELRPMEITFRIAATGATTTLSTGGAIGDVAVERFSNADDKTWLIGRVQIGPPERLTSEYLIQLREDWTSQIRREVAAANIQISSERRRLEIEVARVTEVLHDRRRHLVAAAESAGIPLTAVDSAVLTVPLSPKTISSESANSAARRGEPEASLAEGIADDLVAMVVAFSRALERMPKTANQLIGEDEESIRDVLLFLFNANWQGAATGESFIGEGKSDILLRWRDRDAFIGECKFWKGEKHFEAGLTQLLERYTVWRATRVAMVLFVRNHTNQTKIIEKARGVITRHARFVRRRPAGPPDTFEMRAQHDFQRTVTLSLIPVVLPRTKMSASPSA